MDPEPIWPKTKYVHADHDKVPNETRELDITVQELCEQSTLGIDHSPIITIVLQPPANFSDENNESDTSLNEENVNTELALVLR